MKATADGPEQNICNHIMWPAKRQAEDKEQHIHPRNIQVYIHLCLKEYLHNDTCFIVLGYASTVQLGGLYSPLFQRDENWEPRCVRVDTPGDRVVVMENKETLFGLYHFPCPMVNSAPASHLNSR